MFGCTSNVEAAFCCAENLETLPSSAKLWMFWTFRNFGKIFACFGEIKFVGSVCFWKICFEALTHGKHFEILLGRVYTVDIKSMRNVWAMNSAFKSSNIEIYVTQKFMHHFEIHDLNAHKIHESIKIYKAQITCKLNS